MVIIHYYLRAIVRYAEKKTKRRVFITDTGRRMQNSSTLRKVRMYANRGYTTVRVETLE